MHSNSRREGGKLGFGVRPAAIPISGLPRISCVTVAQSLELSVLAFPRVDEGRQRGKLWRTGREQAQKPAGSRWQPLRLPVSPSPVLSTGLRGVMDTASISFAFN